MSDVFISYSRKDTAFVRRLHEALAARGRDIWVDWEDIPLTAAWWAEIQAGIEAADTFVFVISPEAARSKVCFDEIEHAVQQHKRIVPILHRELTEEADQQRLHPAVNKHNWAFFRAEDNFDAAFDALLTALDTDLDHVRLHTRLLVRAKEWDGIGRVASPLLRGRDLREAEAWLEAASSKDPNPTPLHTEYVLASRRAANRTQRSLFAGVSIALIVALALALLSFVQFTRAEDKQQEAEYQAGVSQSIALGGQAELEINHAPDLAVLLALEALEDYPYTWQAERALGAAVQDYRLKRILADHTNEVNSLAWSPDSTQLVTVSRDTTARVWSVAEGRTVFTYTGHNGMIVGVAWSPEMPGGSRIATGSESGQLRVWDPADGTQFYAYDGTPGMINDLAWSPDGHMVAAAHDTAAVVTLHDLRAGTYVRTLARHEGPVMGVAWSPDGSQIVTASDDGTGAIWDAGSGDKLLDLEGRTTGLRDVAWSPDGQSIAAASVDGTVRVWDAATGAARFALHGHTNEVRGVSWSPDSALIVSSAYDSTVRVWDAATGAARFVLYGHTNRVWGVAWSPDGTKIASAGLDHTARVWEARLGTARLTFTEHRGVVYDVAWSPDGSRIVSVGADHEAYVWDARTGTILTRFEQHSDDVLSAAWSPDGNWIVTTGQDSMAYVWNPDTGRERTRFDQHQGPVFNAVWSPDGTRIISSDGYLATWVWDATTGAAITQILPQERLWLHDAAWSPDGTRIVTVGQKEEEQVWLWDATQWQRELELAGHTHWVWSVAWSWQTNRIVTGSSDTTAHIWDPESGASTAVLTGHIDEVFAVAWSPDGMRVVTGSADRSAIVWDADEGTRLLTLNGHTGYVKGVDWSPDGVYVVTASTDGTVKIWRVFETADDLIDYARGCCAIRDLTPEERALFNLPPVD